MAMRIVADGGGGTYLIADDRDGDPNVNQMQLTSLVSLDGYLEPPVPFAQHLKWGEFRRCENDPKLLARLLARPRAPRHQGTP